MKYLFKPLALLIIVVLIIVASNLFFMYTKDGNNNSGSNDAQTPSDQSNNDGIDNKPDDFTPTSPKIIYEEEPATTNATYFHKVVGIKGQLTYFSFPLEINPEDPPVLIIYSHGSITSVSKDLKDPFMKTLQVYAKQFSKNGYAFLASNEHDANWGNQASLDDIRYSIEFMKNNYKIQPKIYMIGYSMGGLPTLYYSFDHAKDISKIALLAPTTYIWNANQYKSLKDIKIKLWHGNDDVNVPQSASTSFYNNMKKFNNNNNIEYIKMANTTHWDLDPQLAPEIYKFFLAK